MKVKLCGFTEEQTLQTAIEHGCDFVGVVFAKESIRYVNPKSSRKLANLIPQNIAKVAVVVDTNLDHLQEIYDNFAPQYFQIHNAKNVEQILNIKTHFQNYFQTYFSGVKLINAFGISKIEDLQRIKEFEEFADFLLLDNKKSGSGVSFDWELLKDFQTPLPWFLSGGINISNIDDAIKKTNAEYIDISSGIEIERGKKSSSLIIEILEKIKRPTAIEK